jgi:hypothetical protein
VGSVGFFVMLRGTTMVSARCLVSLDHGMKAGRRDAAGALADLDQLPFAIMDQPVDGGA